MATDILTEYAFPKGMNLLSQPELSPEWRDPLIGGLRKFHLFKHFPILWKVMRSIPESLLLRAFPQMRIRFVWEASNRNFVKSLVDAKVNNGNSLTDQMSIFHQLLQSDLPSQEKTIERLWQEGAALLGAGVETTSNALSVTVFHVLNSPQTLSCLRRELHQAIPDSTRLTAFHQLAKLPYLTAVVTEGLRMAIGVTSRFIRVAPDEDTYYQHWKLPAGTAVSMSSMLIHQNPDIFADPGKFLPERWLQGDADPANILAFSKGSRQCVGIK